MLAFIKERMKMKTTIEFYHSRFLKNKIILKFRLNRKLKSKEKRDEYTFKAFEMVSMMCFFFLVKDLDCIVTFEDYYMIITYKIEETK